MEVQKQENIMLKVKLNDPLVCMGKNRIKNEDVKQLLGRTPTR